MKGRWLSSLLSSKSAMLAFLSPPPATASNLNSPHLNDSSLLSNKNDLANPNIIIPKWNRHLDSCSCNQDCKTSVNKHGHPPNVYATLGYALFVLWCFGLKFDGQVPQFVKIWSFYQYFC